MGYAGREDDERTRAAFVLSTIYLDIHRTAQDVENLIDVVNVHSGRRSTACGCLDANNCAVLGARRMVEQILSQALVCAAFVNAHRNQSCERIPLGSSYEIIFDFFDYRKMVFLRQEKTITLPKIVINTVNPQPVCGP